jgi:glycosyltransferase involved in cell wall biosynthesis
LVVGRLEDDRLKGLDLAAKAVGLAAKRRALSASTLELMVRGAPLNTSSELRRRLLDWSGGPTLNIVVRPYTADSESLDPDIRRASLLLMPSRSEGFGLVGLEAIVTGTPVLVSSESGLGELLCETLEYEQAKRIVVRMTGEDENDGEQWGRAVEGMLRDRDADFRRAKEVCDLLARRKTWAGATTSLLSELREALAVGD